MPGGAGEFVGPISVGVAFAVVSSYLLSLTVIAALAGYASRCTRHAGPAAAGGATGFRTASDWQRVLSPGASTASCVGRPSASRCRWSSRRWASP